MIVMKSAFRLDIGLSFLQQCALPLVTDRETRTHRRGRSKAIVRPLPAPHRDPGSGTPTGTPTALSRDFATAGKGVNRKGGSVMCAGQGTSNETSRALGLPGVAGVRTVVSTAPAMDEQQQRRRMLI
jgi:hypothetical protein